MSPQPNDRATAERICRLLNDLKQQSYGFLTEVFNPDLVDMMKSAGLLSHARVEAIAKIIADERAKAPPDR